MFIGHFAVAFAAKRAAPGVSLGTLFLAAQLADLAWPTLVLLGLEAFEIRPGITAVTPLDFVHYPYSHSLVALLGWSLVFAVGYTLARKFQPAAVLTLAVLVLSHWVLDVVTHRPDMPLSLAGDTRLGLGLWNSVSATLAIELALFIGGVALYAAATRPIDRTGRFAFWGLAAFLVVVYFATLVGPPPPSTTAVAWSAQGIWLLVAWGYWIDRHRKPTVA